MAEAGLEIKRSARIVSRSQVGLLLMILGGVVVVAAGVGWTVSASGASEPTPVAVTEVDQDAPTLPPVTDSTDSAITTTTSEVVRSTTTLAQETTTPVSGSELVGNFIPVFAQAIADGDLEFVFSRLHPDIVEAFGEELCRSWVGEEILALTDYKLDGVVDGPSTGSLDTPAGTLTFEDRFAAPVTFLFGGQPYSATADFVVASGDVFFVGTCR